MKIHLVIVDAMNLIRRIHAVQPEQTTIDSTSQHCARALKKIIANTAPTHIVAVFDHKEKDRGWRAKIIPSYKQDRPPMPQVLADGLDDLQDTFFALGVDSVISSGDEADDIVATLAHKLASLQHQVTIISTDKGYCQLLQPTLQIRDYFQQRWLDSRFIEQHFAVLPTQLTDFWGLTGISSSNIQGVSGIGAKTAALLLNRYQNLDTLFNAKDIEAKWQKKLAGNQQIAMQCKQVATLKTDINLGFNLQDIRFNPTN